MKIKYPYSEILSNNSHCLSRQITLFDHLGGFRQDNTNQLFDILQQHGGTYDITWHQILDNTVAAKYPSLRLRFCSKLQENLNFKHFYNYREQPEISYKHLVCSFNGTAHVSRKMLTAILARFGLYHSIYISKNFQYNQDEIDGHLLDYLDVEQHRLYRKFFLDDNMQNYFNSMNSFGHTQFNHANNIYKLEHKLTATFVHVVSETLATSYCPFVTEKFLYSVITRGLFLAYAQPQWHDHVERYYGFRKYNKIFDYQFDTIQNPVERLIALMSMIAKFGLLSSDDWRDLYEMEVDTVEYNYDHYFSRGYLKTLESHGVV